MKRRRKWSEDLAEKSALSVRLWAQPNWPIKLVRARLAERDRQRAAGIHESGPPTALESPAIPLLPGKGYHSAAGRDLLLPARILTMKKPPARAGGGLSFEELLDRQPNLPEVEAIRKAA